MSRYQGAFTALVTPFRDGAIDEEALRELVERQIAGGIHGLVPCGTTGEGATLDYDEHVEVVRIVVEQTKKRVPVIAGAGTNDTRKTIELVLEVEAVGADGLLLVCPYYNRPTQAGLEAHFRAIAKECSLPTMLYNIPGRTGCDLAVSTLAKLADVPSFVAIKEATGNVVRCQQILTELGDRYDVLSGDDALTLSMMILGGTGVVSVTSNLFPAEVAAVTNAANAGDWAKARELHLRLAPVHESMFVESNPGPIKAMMADAGQLAPEVRLPIAWPSEESLAVTRAALTRAGLR
ncbi:MAG: 4-hydroxy-tetrahydrodipicolinate synthase [Sandaracinus sp.]|nr:4-hydroxy-tetrahydrodipicolinate synthase [Sandaracinus sp.]